MSKERTTFADERVFHRVWNPLLTALGPQTLLDICTVRSPFVLSCRGFWIQ